ncbi:MAG TPA: protoporphyrinogen oxidase [Candidatus Sulfomarinibacteraceae bacterium]|nr:protoporphyrinogen oxidase [Candidatus Sulfomarinibacteraceae bacterium]
MTILVVGGGITGLASAYALGRAGIPTLLVEASGRLGGKVRTEVVDGFVIEHGPDSFVSYRPAGVQLCRELGLADAIIRPQDPRIVHIRAGGRFRRFPDGMGLVLPTKFRPFLTSDLFSPLEKARMGLDLILPRDGRTGDVAVGPFLRRRLGRALVDRLAGPLIGGVYGTSIDELSLDAVVPQLRESERRHRSLLLAALADARARNRARNATVGGGGVALGRDPGTAGATEAAGAGEASPSPFVTLSGGTQQLVEALIEALGAMPGVSIRTGTTVEGITLDRTSSSVHFSGGERFAPEATILATPAPVTARLLAPDVPTAAAHLGTIPHGTTAVVNLAYADAQLEVEPIGHGFLVAGDEPLTISAATLTSRKWAGRAPDGTLLVRAFIGDGRAGAHDLDDAGLIGAAHLDIAGTLGIRGRPMLSRVSRYPSAMPHYTVGHLHRVAAAEGALRAYPGIRIAGGAYRGVGLPDCIAQGRAAADAVAALLSGGRTAAGGGAAGADVRSSASRA